MTRQQADVVYRAMHGPIGQALGPELWHAPWDTPFSTIIGELGVAIGGHPGLQRAGNEDRAVVAHISVPWHGPLLVALVCDGVGGSDMGDVAATLAVAAILDDLARPRADLPLEAMLVDAFRKADDVVRNALRGGGTTTATALVVSSSGTVAAANVGDSRIYSWRAGYGIFRQVSVDDTIENELRELHLADASVLDEHGLRGRLSQAIGETERASSDLRIAVFNSRDFERGAILASDGAWRGSEDGYNAIARHAATAADVTRRLLAFARWAGGPDNISVVAIEDLSAVASYMKRTDRPEHYARATVWVCESKVVASTVRQPEWYASSGQSTTTRGARSTESKKKKKKWPLQRKSKRPTDDKQLPIEMDHPGPVKSTEPRPKVEISVDDEPPVNQ